jgi:hypothetical protein
MFMLPYFIITELHTIVYCTACVSITLVDITCYETMGVPSQDEFGIKSVELYNRSSPPRTYYLYVYYCSGTV